MRKLALNIASCLFTSVLAMTGTAAPVTAPILRTTLQASWDENWFGSPAVFDIDKDGKREIIAGRHSVLYVWDSSGSLRWRAPVGENSSSPNDHGSSRQYAAPVVGDFDGDGDGEIAIAFSNKVALYDHRGMLVTGWPQTFPGQQGELRSIAAADLDGDGKLELLAVKTAKGPVTCAWNLDGSIVAGWPQVQNCPECNDYGGYNQNIGAADLDGDGKPEVVSTYDICHIGIMFANGLPVPAHTTFYKAGPWASSVPMFHSSALARQGWGADGNDRDEFTDSPPCFGGFDGDGKPEIVLYSDHEKAGEYVNRGNCLWVLNPDMTRIAGFEQPICSGLPLYTGYENNIVQVAPTLAIGDLDQDRIPEIVVPSYDGVMRCFNSSGSVVWSYRFDTPDTLFIGASGAVIGDLNGDDLPEIVFTTYSVQNDRSHLIILSGSGKELHKVPIAKRGSMSPPTLDDIDMDGKLEIVISLKDVLGGGKGGVQIWNVESSGTNYLPWPTGRGNYFRDGRSSTIGTGVVRDHAVAGAIKDLKESGYVYDIYGRLLHKTGNTPRFRTAGMSSGVYFAASSKHSYSKILLRFR